MNRTDRLEAMLPTWMRVNKIKDFVIVDWNSKEPIINSQIIKDILNHNKNIKIIRVEDQKYFYRCLAWNLANQYTDPANKILLKLDVDYLNIDESWMNYLAIENEKLARYFITGCATFYKSSTGFLLVNKEDFGLGYNENALPVWGYEDTDIAHRLESKVFENPSPEWKDWENKLQRIVFFDIGKYVYHIPHTDKERIENLAYNKLFVTERGGKWQFAQLNKLVFEKKPAWTTKTYTELENNSNYIRVKLN